MAARAVVTDDDRALMRNLYVNGLLPCEAIGDRIGVSRQTVYAVLKKMGVDMSRRKVVVPCAQCKTKISKTRAEIRKHDKHFCDSICYGKYLRRPSVQDQTIKNRQARTEADNFFAYGVPRDMAVYQTSDDILVFQSREAMLEWIRTGLVAEVFSVKSKGYIKAMHKKGG